MRDGLLAPLLTDMGNSVVSRPLRDASRTGEWLRYRIRPQRIRRKPDAVAYSEPSQSDLGVISQVETHES